MQFFRDSAVTMLYWEGDIKIKKGDGMYGYYDNRDINTKFDSNKVKDWNNKILFKFGSNPQKL